MRRQLRGLFAGAGIASAMLVGAECADAQQFMDATAIEVQLGNLSATGVCEIGAIAPDATAIVALGIGTMAVGVFCARRARQMLTP